MTISRGTEWGSAAPTPEGTPFASTNAELFALVQDGVTQVALSGGDLWRVVGGRSAGDRNRRNDVGDLPFHFPVDLVEITLDGNRTVRVAAHAVGHDLLFRHVVAAMNVDFWGRYQLAPRAHPGDGVADVYTATLHLSDVARIAPRARTGTHVPHPAVHLQRRDTGEVELPRAVPIRADGVRVGRSRTLRFRVLPDALTVIV
jgi:hypothetical protein